jgi:uncharacterized protein YdaU (DUF1376 family)
MADFAGLTIWTDAYIGDTQHLTLQENGAYLKLLMIAWRSPGCCLPDDDRRLALMLGVTLKVWMKLKPTVMEFWDLKDGLYYQRRLTSERKKVEVQSKKCKAAAEKRWQHNSLKSKYVDDANASGKHMPRTCSPTPSPSPIKKNPLGSKKNDDADLFGIKNNPPQKKPAARQILMKVAAASEPAIDSYLAYRKKTKAKGTTDRAASLIAKQLTKIVDNGGDPDEALAMAEMNGWQGLDAEWYFKRKGQNYGNANHHSGSAANGRGVAGRSLAHEIADRADRITRQEEAQGQADFDVGNSFRQN